MIEGSSSRLFPGAGRINGLRNLIVSAMQSSIITDESGRQTAGDLYILQVDLKTAEYFEDRSMIGALSDLISEIGEENGVSFPAPPRIKVSSTAENKPGEIKVLAQFSLQDLEETNTLTLDSEDSDQIPEYAFLNVYGNIFPLTQSIINIGRRIDNHVVIEDMRVSRSHAQIRAIKGHYVIFDLDSSGGTYVNGVRSDQATLYRGDVITLAGVDIIYGQDASYLPGEDESATQQLTMSPDNKE